MKKVIIPILCYLFFNSTAQVQFSLDLGYGKMETIHKTKGNDDPFAPSSNVNYLTIFKEKKQDVNKRAAMTVNTKIYKFLSIDASIGYSQGLTQLYRPLSDVYTNGIKTHTLSGSIAPKITLFKYFNLAGGVFYEKIIDETPKPFMIISPQTLWGYVLNPSLSYCGFQLGYRKFIYKEPFFSESKSTYKNVVGLSLPSYYWKNYSIYVGYTFLILGKK